MEEIPGLSGSSSLSRTIEQREIEPNASSSERVRVPPGLQSVALAFLIQEHFTLRALVPTGLEVHYPVPSRPIVDSSIHNHASPIASTHSVLRPSLDLQP